MEHTTAELLESLQDDLSTIVDTLGLEEGTNFSDIKNKTIAGEITVGGGSSYTGHADVEGLTQLGWDENDIKFFQDNCINWNAEEDNLYKVSERDIAGYEDSTTRYIKKNTSSTGFSNRYVLIGMPLKSTKNENAFIGYFQYCNCLVEIPKLNYNNPTSFQNMFQYCFSLKKADFGNITTTNLTSTQKMFLECHSLESVNVDNWTTNDNLTCDQMFRGCSSLKKIDLSTWTVSKTPTLSYLCYDCVNLMSFAAFSVNDTSSSKNFEYMFYDCYNLEKADLSDMKVAPSNMRYMFQNCYSLKEIDLRNFESTNLSNVSYMLRNCSSLQKLDIRKLSISTVSNKSNFIGNVPTDCLIIVKDQTEKSWFASNYSSYTNVRTLEEYESM